ncbi:WD40/YVTN/BNR-like repeat-containing protein [Micromonospora sp. DT81.3]|uniref:WD40/YVTN/BNR-like repeat-containing protein n=1 Tax=Micromonospora sp. DT81.3 TaxID=3416523 RepID=UPI003CF1BA56
MNAHTRSVAAATLAATLPLAATACTAAADSESPAPLISHVHDVVFDPGGALLVGAHTGAYRVDLTTGEVSLVGEIPFDAMGLTVQADTILASGHPGPDSGDTFAAPNVGLVRYTDAGWEEVSLAGVTDFHMLATTPAAPELVLGLPSDRAFLAASTDAGETWVDAAPLIARDISIDTIEPDIVTATTPDGLMVSRDAGTTFSPLANAPGLVVIAADPALEEGIIGVDASGTIWTGTTKPSAVWRTAGHATGLASAIAANPEGTVAIVDEGGVRVTNDAGATWQVVIRTEP